MLDHGGLPRAHYSYHVEQARTAPVICTYPLAQIEQKLYQYGAGPGYSIYTIDSNSEYEVTGRKHAPLSMFRLIDMVLILVAHIMDG